MAVAVKALKEAGGGSLQSVEWREMEGVLYHRDWIYVSKNTELQQRIVEQHHDTQITGHARHWKTLELVSRSYWWPQMSHYIGQYCNTCDLCLQTKIQRHPPTGELQPLPVLTEQWDTISVDFIVELPEAHGYDAAMIMVDSTGKHGHFILTHMTITANGVAQLFLNNVWKLHGLPQNIISDCGLQFISEFMKELYQLLGIKLSTSTAYHPQTDKQMEHLNQEYKGNLMLWHSVCR
jgi:hypothetical protein